MLCLAATAFAVLVFLAVASEAPENATGIPTQVNANATLSAWSEAGAYMQLALAAADAQLLPIAGDDQ
jgi:hypothetical protein